MHALVFDKISHRVIASYRQTVLLAVEAGQKSGSKMNDRKIAGIQWSPPVLIGLCAILVIRHGRYAPWVFPCCSGPYGLSFLQACSLPVVVGTSLEDQVLQLELPGYLEYAEKVRARLVPGLW